MKDLFLWLFAPWFLLFESLAGMPPRKAMENLVNNPCRFWWPLLVMGMLATAFAHVRFSGIIELPPEMAAKGVKGVILFYGLISAAAAALMAGLFLLFGLLANRLRLAGTAPGPAKHLQITRVLIESAGTLAWLNLPGIGFFALIFAWLYRYRALRTRLELSREEALRLLCALIVSEAFFPTALLWGIRFSKIL